MADSSRARAHVTPPSFIRPRPPVTGESTQLVPDAQVHLWCHLPALLTIKDVIRESGMSKTVVFTKLKTGEIRSITPHGRSRRIPLDWFIEWIEEHKTNAVRATDLAEAAR